MNPTSYSFWPEQASTFAVEVDNISITLIALTVFFTGLVLSLLIFFALRYRRGQKVNRSNRVHSHTLVELAWSTPPLILGLLVFAWAVKPYFDANTPPADADEVLVIGKQWMWHLQHAKTGIRENNELHVPVGKNIKLTLISQDVIHGFYVPAFRLKRDAIPGAYNSFWFKATKPGKYYLFCTEYCGTNHSQMGGWVYVLSQADYNEWVKNKGRKDPKGKATLTMEEQGEAIFRRNACGNCHTSESDSRAPSLVGLYGRDRILQSGKKVMADRNYLRTAIIKPEDVKLRGYGTITRMPTYSNLSEDDVNQLIAYIKSLSPTKVASK